MNDLGIKSRHIARFLGLGFSLALAGFWAQNAPAAVNMTYVLKPESNEYWSGEDYDNADFYIANTAAWTEITQTNVWYASGATINGLPNDAQKVYFLRVKDYYLPAPSNHTYAAVNPTLTNLYKPYSNNLTMMITGVVGGVDAYWRLTSWPTEFTNASIYSSEITNWFTNTYSLTNIPSGTYAATFDGLLDHYKPSNTNVDVGSEHIHIITNLYVAYTNNFIVSPCDHNTNVLASATWTILSYTNAFTNSRAYINQGTNGWGEETYANVPTGTYVVFFYPYASNYATPSPITNDITGTATQTFTGIYTQTSAYADSDGDRLPDEWESAYGLDPYDPNGDNGWFGNPDGDWIPSVSTNAPVLVTILTNVTTYLAADGSDPAYPLRGIRLYDPAESVQGYARTNRSFYNGLECCGLDGYYRTNGPSNTWVPDDDPYTDPGGTNRVDYQSGDGFDTTKPGSQANKFSDGWKYYFWYWRSTNAFARGVTNGAGLDWVLISPTNITDPDYDTDNDGISDGNEYNAGTDPTHTDSDGDSMDDYWEDSYSNISICYSLNVIDGTLNFDDDYFACSTNVCVLTDGTAGTVLSTSVYYIGTVTDPMAAWDDTWTNLGVGRFDIYRDTIIRVSGTLTNGATGILYACTNYYGTTISNLTGYKSGYPVWADLDNSGTYSSGDAALVNPLVKNEYFYQYLVTSTSAYPGVTSFDPRTAWSLGSSDTNEHPNTVRYVNYQEYMGGDYLGRLSWGAGGNVPAVNGNNDGDGVPTARTAYTNPGTNDTDSDVMPDGWELYVGLNPNDVDDAATDSDNDGLVNSAEWANSSHSLGIVTNWLAKNWPTDPGFITAPSPNDPHPADTDWDGLTDGEEMSTGLGTNLFANPNSYDSDNDMLPDGWEYYAGTDPMVSDANEDPDGDGLENWREYWTGTVPEWMYCDANWSILFCSRRAMSWDPAVGGEDKDIRFVPPDFLTCPAFLYANQVFTNLSLLRSNYPAASAKGSAEYHTTLANNADSDADTMDDYWEAYHGLNPLKGQVNLMMPVADDVRVDGWGGGSTGVTDADPNTSGFQFGTAGAVFTNLFGLIDYVGTNWLPLLSVIGPFNFGLDLMDPDGDGLPNMDEYSYSAERVLYHTDPSPMWRTDDKASDSFVTLNYTRDFFGSFAGGDMPGFWTIAGPEFIHERTEGFDTDNDGIGDYDEINGTAGCVGSDPLDSRNPIRNRALLFNGTSDFTRTMDTWAVSPDSVLARFCVEAWVRSGNPLVQQDQVAVEKAGSYENPYTGLTNIVRANFRLGITNGLPYVMYNGRGAMTAYQATAQVAHRLQSNAWAHIAGSYDGTNLTVYVNGEASTVTPTTELPANGFSYETGVGDTVVCHPQAIMVGARDSTAGTVIYTPTDYFAGCIDEVRIWNGTRSRDQVIANMDRRLTAEEMTNSAIWAYYTFDDVPDPVTEGIVPAGMDTLDTTLSFHPTIGWWSNLTARSTVYTGSAARPYNYIVVAENHYAHRRIMPPLDDPYHYPTNNMTTNGTYEILPGYRYTSNPYGPLSSYDWTIEMDLVLFRGTRSVATNSWLPGLTPGDPDSTDADGDGLPDWWEIAHGLDPYSAEGENGAWGDPDFDGLNNRAEYLAGIDPKAWDTDGDGISDYDSRSGPGTRTWGELYNDGDGMPDTWETLYGLDPNYYDAHLDKDNDGWNNYAEYQAGTDPSDATSYPLPVVSGYLSYEGTNTSSLRILAYQTNTMDGVPAAEASGMGTNFTITGLKEGDFYLFGFLDQDGDSSWSSGEPCGVAYPQPARLSWTSLSDINLGLRDSYPGYGRFAWTDVSTNTTNTAVEVIINRISQSGSPTVVQRTIRSPRSYFYEWDYQLSGIYGLSAGAYQWWVGSRNGTFNVQWPSSVSKPYLVSPRGDLLYYGRNQIEWTMDRHATMYHVQIADASAAIITNYYLPAPYPDSAGVYRDTLPFYMGEWANGAYFWRLAGYNPSGESEWSDVQTFNIDLSSTNSYWISGDIYYFGKARATNIYVEAFTSPDFGGDPDSRVLYRLPCTTNGLKTTFTLRGLRSKTYYVRAFTDITPAAGVRNGQFDYWESWGFVRNPSNDYQPRIIAITNTHFIEGTQIIIRDRDTDNDELPDAWEMSYFGNLDQTGDMDYDGDGENNLTEYALDYLDTDPTKFDTDADGLTDYYEHHYGNNADYDPYDAIGNPDGKSLNPTRWDTDGDMYSDGAEIRRYHTNPLDPASHPLYSDGAKLFQPPCYGPCASPADYDSDGRTDVGVYDPVNAMWYLLTWQGQFFSGQFGSATTQPLLGDYDGDGKTDAALFDTLSGTWYIYTWQGQFGSLAFGDADMTPVPADYDGDFMTDLGVYDGPTGTWYLYGLFSGQFTTFQFGNSTCIPVPGDYDGDGKYDFAVYNTADQTWYIYTWRGDFTMFQFGRPGCIPVPGDYDGDGRYDFAVYEVSTCMWYIFTWNQQFASGPFGWNGVIPVSGDYDGDGRRDVAVYYPDTGMWYVYTIAGNLYDGQFGWPAATPVLGGR